MTWHSRWVVGGSRRRTLVGGGGQGQGVGLGSAGGQCGWLLLCLWSAVFVVCTIYAHVRADCPHVGGARGAVHSSSTHVRGLWAVCWTTPTVGHALLACSVRVMLGWHARANAVCEGQHWHEPAWVQSCAVRGQGSERHLPLHVTGSTGCMQAQFVGVCRTQGCQTSGVAGPGSYTCGGLKGGSSAPWAAAHLHPVLARPLSHLFFLRMLPGFTGGVLWTQIALHIAGAHYAAAPAWALNRVQACPTVCRAFGWAFVRCRTAAVGSRLSGV